MERFNLKKLSEVEGKDIIGLFPWPGQFVSHSQSQFLS
jgi:hypothetical protein